jgi:maltose alpha-D-glucosyltransferase/alpha-amylase
LSARLLGQRTGELHKALASDGKDPALLRSRSRPVSALAHQSFRTIADQSLSLLEKRLPGLAEDIRPDAAKILQLEGAIFDRLRQIVDKKMTGTDTLAMATFTLARCFSPARTLSLSISKANRPDRSLSED